MRILFLSDNFPPEGNAPATRLWEHATRWVRAGHEVTVITGAPNFPEGILYSGYKNRWYHVENMEGIRVVRVKTYITANEGFLKRTLDYLSFMLSAFLAGLFERKPDLIVATSPQFFCSIAGWMLAGIRRKPFVFELRDLWPASIVAVGAMERSLAIRLLERIELFLYRRADAVISVTNSFKDDLVKRGISADKIHVVINGVDLDRYEPAQRDRELEQLYGLKNKFVVGYIGTHGMAHGLPKVIEAAERIRSHDDIVFLFAGGGAAREEIERLVNEKGLDNVRLISRQPKEIMPRIWSLCDVSLIPLRDDPVFSTVIPSKLFEGMGMGIPAVMSLPEGEATRIVRDTGAGVVLPPEDSASLADVLLALHKDPKRLACLGAAGLSSAPKFSREKQAKKMVEIFDSIARC